MQDFGWGGGLTRNMGIDGYGRTPQGGRGGLNRFSKNLIFERFAAKFFSKVSRGFSEGQKGIV